MNEDSQNMLGFLDEMNLIEAILKQVNERIFQINGYVDLIDKSELSDEDKEYILGIKDVAAKLHKDIHTIIDHYRETD